MVANHGYSLNFYLEFSCKQCNRTASKTIVRNEHDKIYLRCITCGEGIEVFLNSRIVSTKKQGLNNTLNVKVTIV
jgi:transcription elongation factor Elf1